MHAMVFDRPGRPLQWREVPRPEPGPGQVLVRVSACGVRRTDLPVVDGELPHPKPPSARWCRWRCGRCDPATRWSAPGST